MNIKHLLFGSLAAMCLLALPASAASPGSGTESGPCPIVHMTDPGSGTGTITAQLGDEVGFGPQTMALKEIDVFTGPQLAAITGDDPQIAGDSGSVIAPQAGPKDGKLAHTGDGGTIFLAAVIKPNNPMPLTDKVAKRTSAPAPVKPVDVTTLASADIPWPSIDSSPGGTGGITPYPCGWGKQAGFDCFEIKGSGLI